MGKEQDNRALVDGCPHDLFFISPIPIRLDGIYMQVNRAGFTSHTQTDFHITRTDSYSFNVVHCVTGGSGGVKFRNRRYALKRGNVFVLPAREAHEYWSDADNPLGLVWVEFAGGNSTTLTEHILSLGGPDFGKGIFQPVMNLCTSVLYHEDLFSPKISRILYDMLMEFCIELEQSRTCEVSDQKIVNYIDRHLDKPLTMKEVAQEFGYHPSYFSSLFSKAMGMPFTKYVFGRRINRACFLLVTSKWSIERIAQELGFYDESHFCTRFKSAMNMSPLRYRQEGRSLFLEAESLNTVSDSDE